MASSLAETDAVPFRTSCMDASIPTRPAWPASASSAVSVVADDTASTVPERVSAVWEIIFDEALTWAVDAACWFMVASNPLEDAAISVEEDVTWLPDCCI